MNIHLGPDKDQFYLFNNCIIFCGLCHCIVNQRISLLNKISITYANPTLIYIPRDLSSCLIWENREGKRWGSTVSPQSTVFVGSMRLSLILMCFLRSRQQNWKPVGVYECQMLQSSPLHV